MSKRYVNNRIEQEECQQQLWTRGMSTTAVNKKNVNNSSEQEEDHNKNFKNMDTTIATTA